MRHVGDAPWLWHDGHGEDPGEDEEEGQVECEGLFGGGLAGMMGRHTRELTSHTCGTHLATVPHLALIACLSLLVPKVEAEEADDSKEDIPAEEGEHDAAVPA